MSAAPSGGALPPQLTLELQIAGVGEVPVDAVGVALNVTVTDPLAAGFLTVYPCGERPMASNLNYVADQTVPNFVIAALDPEGAVCIDTMSVTDVVVDLAGYLPAGSAIVPLPTPQRFLDTRIGLGTPVGRVPGLSVLPVPLAGSYGIPADASAVIVNATEVDPIADGFLTVAPCLDYGGGVVGIASGGTSTLNFTTGEIVPNLVVSSVGAGGRLCFYSTVQADLVADVAAYVPAGSQGLVTLAAPRRVVDTRFGQGSAAVPLDSTVRHVEFVDIGGNRVVPTDATAAIVNLTATRGMQPGYVTAFPCDQPAPLSSNVNFAAGENVANMAIVRLAAGAQLCMRSMVPVDVIVDVSGYTTGDEALVALTPTRLYDSRMAYDAKCGLSVRRAATGLELVGGPRGGTVALPGLPTLDLYRPRVLISTTCVVHVMLGYPSGGGTPASPNTFEFDQNGNMTRSYTTIVGAYPLVTPSGLLEVTQGYLQPPRLVRADDRSMVFSLPDMGQATGNGNPLRLWTPLGATADGSMIAMAVVAADGLSPIAGYFSASGDLLELAPMPFRGTLVSMSTDGAYLAHLQSTGSVSGDVVVTTLAGEEVARTHSTQWVNSWPVFVGTGRMVGCAYVQGHATLAIWDLFREPTTFWPPTDVSCVLAAG